MSRSRIVCLLLALITLLLYLPVRHHEFVNYDDPDYVSANRTVQAGLTWPGVKWAFTTWHMSNWHPLTWLSHMLDCQLFGLDAGKHHLVNALIHSLNAVLLLVLLLRLTGAFRASAFAAAVFAWHPLRVQSVAWVAERKDVLCACFGLLTLLFYVRYAQNVSRVGPRCARPDTHSVSLLDHHGSTLDYLLALLLFALGLMAKPMLVTLPFVFLLLDYWPLQRGSSWRRLILEKWPFFTLTAASCVVTFLVQKNAGAVAPLERYGLGFRLENSVISYATYLLKCVWPVNLAVIYPLPREIPWTQTLAATVMLALITALIWRARRRAAYLLTGWLWFLGMLVPVIGLAQLGLQAMADRYTYLPMVGILIGVTFGARDLAVWLKLKPAILIVGGGLVLVGCLLTTAWQLRFWRNSETLYERALAVTRDNPSAHNNLGAALLERGRVVQAISHFEKVVELLPGDSWARYNLGRALVQNGQPAQALVHFRKALEIRPHYTAVLNDLAWILATSPQASLRDGAAAVELAEQADRLSEGRNSEMVSTLAAAYAEAGRFPEALATAHRALLLASTQHDTVSITTLKARIQCFETGAPFRDVNLTNALHERPLPRK